VGMSGSSIAMKVRSKSHIKLTKATLQVCGRKQYQTADTGNGLHDS
jgi:hypothetical protein